MEISDDLQKRLEINRKELEFLHAQSPSSPPSLLADAANLTAVLLFVAWVLWSHGVQGAAHLIPWVIVAGCVIRNGYQARQFHKTHAAALELIKFYRDRQDKLDNAPRSKPEIRRG
ncbi:MAG: hypothetical protein HY078_03450 [Elusimicrobia bacterium]|nr:hypothetical protein [Elusimicrobiota bacterium]